ncbi:prepilin peptidase [Pseudolabrys taiwanensis]|uniref:Prepilin peptidase n=1 Tax=Pseudolabrys taiwanensis TaxID=331696 RepID=A0A346A182_9HYPH|nr:prepilin peptidase [Pseudolabrys taiwanensis]AXK82929.1 prepilin peptidase [Pseudolabrys taiwanensis]
MSILLVRAVLWPIVLVLLSVAAVQDVRARIIPNRLVLAVAAVGLVAAAVERPAALWLSLLFAFLLLGGLGVLTHYDVLGAGDAKMIAAVTLMTPPERSAVVLFAIAMAGGVLSLGYLIAYHTLKRRNATTGTTALARWRRNERARIATGQSVPYAVAILGGAVAYYISEIQRCLSVTSCSP